MSRKAFLEVREVYALPRKLLSSAAQSKYTLNSELLEVEPRSSDWKKILKDCKVAPYDLSNICGSIDGERDTAPAKKKKKRNDEDAIVKWLQRSNSFFYEEVEMCITRDKEEKEFKECPSLFSSRIKPDLTIRYKGLPLCLFEVDSSPYHGTLNKTALVLLDHFCWLRNGNREIDEWKAFTFPKSGKKSCVTIVTVQWLHDELKFKISFKHLANEALDEEVYSVCQEAIGKMLKEAPEEIKHGIPLSSSSLKEMGSDGNFSQLPSRCCIIACDYDKKILLKFICDGSEYKMVHKLTRRMELLPNKSSLPSYLLPSGDQDVGEHLFFKFPLLLRHMSQEQARECFRSFFESVSKAIQALHDDLKVAHLDIRLENICFRCNDDSSATAVLIDLDRAAPIHKSARNVRYCNSGSCMYKVPMALGGFTVEQLDWRQLGILMMYVKYGSRGKSYHKMEVSHRGDKVIKALLEGVPFEEDHEIACLPGTGDKSLIAVLEKRESDSA
eukprot:m.45427 g.45427  ORF g.45427 m.45427 type:complete len:500 (+) comp33594_c0_seq1:43-1542(+)